MADDFMTMIADSEDLLKATATVSGEGFTVARARFEGEIEERQGQPGRCVKTVD